MIQAATYQGFVIRRRRARAFFLSRSTQQVKSLELAREMLRAAAALACAAMWASVFFVLVG